MDLTLFPIAPELPGNQVFSDSGSMKKMEVIPTIRTTETGIIHLKEFFPVLLFLFGFALLSVSGIPCFEVRVFIFFTSPGGNPK